MKENSDTFALHANKQVLRRILFSLHIQSGESNKEFTFVDIPGNYRVRAKINEYLPSLRKIVFVIDSVEFDNEAIAVAQ